MAYYTSEALNEHLYVITDAAGVHAFLALGERRALLMDTCCGLGDIREEIRKITSLPLTVWCSHGHLDHAGGAGVFPVVYLNPLDLMLAHRRCTRETRIWYVKRVLREEYDFREEEYVPQKLTGFLPLHDGDEIDLGGLTCRAVSLGGHTPGSMCVLLKELRMVFLADACNRMTYMMLEESLSLEEYIDHLKAFRDMYYDSFDTGLVCHDEAVVDKVIIPNTIEVGEEILRGEDLHEERLFFGHEGVLAKAIVPHKPVRRDGILGNIAYNKYKVLRKGNPL